MGNLQTSTNSKPITAVEEIDTFDQTNSSQIVKLAYVIGINYTGTDSQLNGCINDSYNLRQFLIDNKYVATDNIHMLNDNMTGNLYPSRNNILTLFANLVKVTTANPDKKYLIFISYSGHGTYVTDTNGDESDRRDEALCPIDFDTNGLIIDDEIKLQFINKLPSNVRLVMLIDSCHSGTVLDIKYNYKIDGTSAYTTTTASDSAARIVMISGSNDSQTSADAYITNKYTLARQYQGAMTAGFLATFVENITYESLVQNMRSWLKTNGFTQIPQLSSSQPINIKLAHMLNKFNNW